MKYLILVEDNGLISQVISYVEEGSSVITDPRLKEIDVELEPFEIIETRHWDFVENSLGEHANQVSPFQEWDSESKTFVYNLSALTHDIKQKIDSKRASIEISPISYNEKSLDADAEAIKNINGKLQELQAKESLSLPIDVNSLFWRDADNIIHSWESVAEYKTWLQGLAIAIAERTSNLYQISWAKKAEIDAIVENETLSNEEKLQNLLSYDVNAGWDI